MAGFDDSALKRLEELTSRSRTGSKLPPTEALELRELKLLKSAADISKRRAEIAVAKRKIAQGQKYRIGGLAVAAGLDSWTDDDLKAAFASLKARDNSPAAGLPNGSSGASSHSSQQDEAASPERVGEPDQLL